MMEKMELGNVFVMLAGEKMDLALAPCVIQIDSGQRVQVLSSI